MVLDLTSTLAAVPPLDAAASEYRSQVRSLLEHDTGSQIPLLVALDDDPTGTQTCHDVSVLTVWDVATLTAEFRRHTNAAATSGQTPGFFILTNSRALHPEPARQLIQEICRHLQEASAAVGRSFEVVLRGDSTLRGHFPLEPEAVESVLGVADAWILCPFFLQGGRYTISDVHYVAEKSEDGTSVLVPAAETPFAKDATFGYKSSNLRDYVVEKSSGAIPAGHMTSISLDTIRQGGPGAIQTQLESLPTGRRNVVVINAAAEEDVDAVVMALLKASCSKRFLFRTGAAFVSARLGIAPIEPISAAQLSLEKSPAGGLIIAGSYVPKTTAQLDVLTTEHKPDVLTTVVINVDELLKSDDAAKEAVDKALAAAEESIAAGRDVLIMTSRRLVVGSDEAASLDIGATVARTLVSFLVQLKTKPRYVIAKGGITSSDMATKGLNFRRALVVGQAAPGVPLWRCDEPTCKWPGLPYVVFPGNVGSNETLSDVVKAWRS
ncbi:ketose-bisphosphate aldolase class-ii family protein [Ophiostoma piceae UAMH 11346]|uniref:Ketose-bisphosphate aldolase class-ii family protein n=1 Tax=Ophiostoma piceae (strain UAMH 11346) TaxID=1262450 RepID=S3C859_OPHP1|nr:ketose-bisphosphate aldolase class-ii family protein [Ophiostoma piceae UAMH 11346]